MKNIEKNELLEGELDYLKKKIFFRHAGLSLMPEIFEKFFNEFDVKICDLYDLKQLDPCQNNI